jgi:hypothetical protein
MVDLLSLIGDAQSDAPSYSELWLSSKPATVLLFTTDVELANLHYEDDRTARGWVVCCGNGCLYCRFGDKPQGHYLLPVVHLDSASIRFLRIRESKGPKTLVSQLKPFLARTDTRDIAVVISREGAEYSVRSCPLRPDADRCDAAVKQFTKDVEEGLRLSSVLRCMTPDEMNEIPRFRRLLESLDLGEQPPTGAPSS